MRRTSALAVVALFSFFSATAVASDPLLSGYGGPGGGEQVVIGTTVLPPVSGDGDLRQSIPAETTASSTSSEPGTKAKTEKKASGDRETIDTAASAGLKPTYPREASTASGLPFATSDLLVLLIGAGAVGLTAFFFHRNTPTDQ